MDFTFWQYLAICVLVALAGFVDSIAGGGGLISLPAYFAIGLPPHAALATNKFSSVCGTSFAVLRYWRAGAVSIRAGLAAAAGALFGSALGARLALAVSAEAINTMMLVLVPLVLAVFLLRAGATGRPGKGRGAKGGVMAASAAIGAVVGAYDGFFGPGTGTFMAIGFSVILGFGLLTSEANARLANLASNAGAVAVFLVAGKVLFPLALYAAAAGIAGNLIGSRLAIRRGARIIRPLTIIVLVLLMGEIVRRRWL